MSKIDLTKYGITDVKEIVHNPSYEVLFAEETNPNLEGYEKGQLTELDTVNVMTGIYTGRSPKDKFFVMNEASKDTVWWTSEEYKNDNKPCSEEAWNDLRAKAIKQLSGKKLYVVDTFCGTNEATRLKVRFIMEVAWQAPGNTRTYLRRSAEWPGHPFRPMRNSRFPPASGGRRHSPNIPLVYQVATSCCKCSNFLSRTACRITKKS